MLRSALGGGMGSAIPPKAPLAAKRQDGRKISFNGGGGASSFSGSSSTTAATGGFMLRPLRGRLDIASPIPPESKGNLGEEALPRPADDTPLWAGGDALGLAARGLLRQQPPLRPQESDSSPSMVSSRLPEAYGAFPVPSTVLGSGRSLGGIGSGRAPLGSASSTLPLQPPQQPLAVGGPSIGGAFRSINAPQAPGLSRTRADAPGNPAAHLAFQLLVASPNISFTEIAGGNPEAITFQKVEPDDDRRSFDLEPVNLPRVSRRQDSLGLDGPGGRGDSHAGGDSFPPDRDAFIKSRAKPWAGQISGGSSSSRNRPDSNHGLGRFARAPPPLVGVGAAGSSGDLPTPRQDSFPPLVCQPMPDGDNDSLLDFWTRQDSRGTPRRRAEEPPPDFWDNFDKKLKGHLQDSEGRIEKTIVAKIQETEDRLNEKIDNETKERKEDELQHESGRPADGWPNRDNRFDFFKVQARRDDGEDPNCGDRVFTRVIPSAPGPFGILPQDQPSQPPPALGGVGSKNKKASAGLNGFTRSLRVGGQQILSRLPNRGRVGLVRAFDSEAVDFPEGSFADRLPLRVGGGPAPLGRRMDVSDFATELEEVDITV